MSCAKEEQVGAHTRVIARFGWQAYEGISQLCIDYFEMSRANAGLASGVVVRDRACGGSVPVVHACV